MSTSPAPWTAQGITEIGGLGYACIVDDAGVLVAYVLSPSDAELLAVSPDLLTALKLIVAEVDGPDKPHSADSYLPPHLIKLARAAIQKAEGKS